MTNAQHEARAMLKKNAKYLTKQQKKTLNGLIKAGDAVGAMNGMHTIISRVFLFERVV